MKLKLSNISQLYKLYKKASTEVWDYSQKKVFFPLTIIT
ncbi:hypothetical protein FLACHUCJ7_00473 [Flavobacterium chungangense]|uniref:Uncharacterized protein n=1 Tax=Flavobacterium chungangense TaxID=554283 RepID=A0A6V6YPL9_9FLAO|nr:hypothetical protein FLACHUCJ7_00473 [Flavobacterium chungangense]